MITFYTIVFLYICKNDFMISKNNKKMVLFLEYILKPLLPRSWYSRLFYTRDWRLEILDEYFEVNDIDSSHVGLTTIFVGGLILCLFCCFDKKPTHDYALSFISMTIAGYVDAKTYNRICENRRNLEKFRDTYYKQNRLKSITPEGIFMLKKDYDFFNINRTLFMHG